MTSKTHDVFAFASLITIAGHYPPPSLNGTTIFIALIGNIVGSLFPDIDQASNRLWDLLPAGNSIGKVFRKILLGHRTLSHSLLGIFLVHQLLWFVLPKILNSNTMNIDLIYYSIMIGFVSHLFLDMWTEEGIPLFFPMRWKIGIPPFSSWRIKTGKWFEKYVVFPGIIAYSFWFIFSNKEKIIAILKLAIK